MGSKVYWMETFCRPCLDRHPQLRHSSTQRPHRLWKWKSRALASDSCPESSSCLEAVALRCFSKRCWARSNFDWSRLAWPAMIQYEVVGTPSISFEYETMIACRRSTSCWQEFYSTTTCKMPSDSWAHTFQLLAVAAPTSFSSSGRKECPSVRAFWEVFPFRELRYRSLSDCFTGDPDSRLVCSWRFSLPFAFLDLSICCLWALSV